MSQIARRGDLEYTADQLRAYAAQVEAATIERCARVCEAEYHLGIDDERSYNGRLMAAAIRALGQTREQG